MKICMHAQYLSPSGQLRSTDTPTTAGAYAHMSSTKSLECNTLNVSLNSFPNILQILRSQTLFVSTHVRTRLLQNLYEVTDKIADLSYIGLHKFEN
jgi:hypothetical protein